MIVPTILIPLGISGYYAAKLGSDPYSVFIDGLQALTGLTHGTVVIILSVVVVTLMFFFGRRYFKVGTIVLALTIGPLIDVFLPALTTAMYYSGEADLILRAAVMLGGAFLMAVGIGLFIAIDFGIGTIEWVVILISKRLRISIGRAKIAFDAVMVATGWLMGGLVGVGTIVGIVVTGLLIDATLKLIDKPIKRFVGPLRSGETEKSSLRKLIAEKRKNLSGDAIEISDRKILQNLLAIPQYKKAKTIFCFVSTTDEIDTKGIIENALSMSKRVCVPRCEKFGVMHAYEIKTFDDLQPGKYGISEPKENCPYIAPHEIDFAIIPCVTCDKQGHRLGYGGGFYDRYIQNQTFTKAALCRKALQHEDIPLEPHDMAVDIVVTD